MNSKSVFYKLAVLVILFFILVVGVDVIHEKVVDALQAETAVSDGNGESAFVDWEKEYPFETISEKSNSDQEKSNDKPGLAGRYKSLFARVKAVIEGSKENIPFYTQFLELSGYMDRISGRTDFSEKGIVVLKNGHLGSPQALKETEAVEATANNIEQFSKWLDQKEIPFLYLQIPVKSDPYNNQFPDDVKDYSNENMDMLLENLDSRGISCLDLRRNIHEQGMDLYDMYYRTDHHWTLKSGIWAAGEVADRLNEEFEFDFDTSVVDINNYAEKTYKNWFLGSWGRKVTLGFADPEDFSIYIPEFETNMRIVHQDKGMDLTGTFEDVVFDYNILDECDYYKNNTYGSLLYGNRPLTQITNYNREEGKHILFIRDSFSLAMVPYFSLMCRQTDLIDARAANGNFNGSIKTYIEEMKPDAVILMYNPEDYEFR